MSEAVGSIGGAISGAFGALGQGLEGAAGYGQAGQTIGQGTDQATNYLQQYYTRGMDATSPYAQAGEGVLSGMTGVANQAYGAYPALLAMAQDPSLNQYVRNAITANTQAVNSKAAASGLGGSGANLQAVSGGTSNILGQNAQNQFSQLAQAYGYGANAGSQLAGLGGQAAGQQLGLAASTGRGLASTVTSGASNLAEMQLGSYNAMGNLYGNLGAYGSGAATGYQNTVNLQDYLNASKG